MLQTARLPEAKLKPIFDAPQWRLLSRQFAQGRAMEHWLKTNGVLALGENEGEPAAIGVVPGSPLVPAVPDRKAVNADKPSAEAQSLNCHELSGTLP